MTAATNVSRVAIAEQLELMARYTREGTIVGFSAYWDDHRLARFSVTYEDGREEEMPLPGMQREEDEDDD